MLLASVDIKQKQNERTNVELPANAVSLLESGEWRYIKAIDNRTNQYKVPGEIKRSGDLEEGGGAGPSS